MCNKLLYINLPFDLGVQSDEYQSYKEKGGKRRF